MNGTNVKSLSVATTTTIVVAIVMTIWSELSSTFKDFLRSVTGHHWVTKSVFLFIIFFAVYFLYSKSDDNLDVLKESLLVIIASILAVIVITGFFIIHFLLE